VSSSVKRDASDLWLKRYTTDPMTAAAPRGQLNESFVCSHASGSDSVVTRANDDSRFWIKRVKLEDGATVFAGPFDAR
jgi:hypothetical protein